MTSDLFVDDEVCWICLEGTHKGFTLTSPCLCPRKVHPQCLARWQLQQAGRREESTCRFCYKAYPDWKQHITPDHLRPVVQNTEKTLPYMAVVYGEVVHKIPVRPGPEGIAEFKAKVKSLFGFPPDLDFEVTFECKDPASEEKVLLKGLKCFEAATHCAAVSAAKRARGEGSSSWP